MDTPDEFTRRQNAVVEINNENSDNEESSSEEKIDDLDERISEAFSEILDYTRKFNLVVFENENKARSDFFYLVNLQN